MNLKSGFRRITLILAILVGIICGGTAIGILMDKRSSAIRHLAQCEKEFSKSIPVGDPNERPAGWPKWSSEKYSSYSNYLHHVSSFLFSVWINLPLLYGEEDKKYREEHNIPPDSTDRFYTDEAIKIVRKYGECFEKSRLLMSAYSFWASLSTSGFIGLLVLMSLGCAIAGFCGTWFVYGIISWMVFGFQQDIG